MTTHVDISPEINYDVDGNVIATIDLKIKDPWIIKTSAKFNGWLYCLNFYF